MVTPVMACHVCGKLADQICTMCGRPFCPAHGGMRLYHEGGSQVLVTRALCDEHTPNQWFLANRYFVIFPVFAAVLLVIYFGCIKPDKERRDRAWDEKVKQQHREHEEFRRRGGFSD